TALGIDLGNDGPTPNGINPRAFPNDGQNFPVLGPVQPGDTSVSGTLTTAPGSYRVELFVTPPGGAALQGKTFLGFTNVTVPASGSWPSGRAGLVALTEGSVLPPPAPSIPGPAVLGATSEFSVGVPVVNPPVTPPPTLPSPTSAVPLAIQQVGGVFVL